MIPRVFISLLACTLIRVQATEIPALPVPNIIRSVQWNDLSPQALPQATDDKKLWSHDSSPEGSGFVLKKLSGSGYASLAGLYSANAEYRGPLTSRIMAGEITDDDLPQLKPEDFVNVGRFQIAVSEAIPRVRIIAFQIAIHGLSKGRHFSPFGLTQHVFPATLSYNEGDQNLPATVHRMVTGSLNQGMPGEIYALLWDVSSIPETIHSFTITWSVYPHSCTSAIEIGQGTTFLDPFRN